MGTVYVGNVGSGMLGRKGALSELFRDAAGAEATKEKVPSGSGGKPKGFAFLTFADARAYKRALELHGFEWEGRPLNVKPANDPSAPKA